MGRLREKYAAKMAATPDARAFAVVSAPLGTNGTEFRDIARAAASIDTLDGFLRDMQTRYPDASAIPPPGTAAANAPAGGAPVTSAAPGTHAAAPAPVPPSRAAGKTALR